MTTQETKKQAIILINRVITLKANVKNGCFSDKAELDQQEPRLAKVKQWAKDNDQIQDIIHYLGSTRFGNTKQFAASEVHTFFCN
jgi:hypothetical protein